MTTSARSFRLVPLALVMGTIFFLSHQPGTDLQLLHIPGLDKLAHMVVYGLLAAAVFYALPATFTPTRPGRTSILVVLFCTVYGMTDEFHQSFIPGREASLADIAADAAGAAAMVFLLLRYQRTGKKSSWNRNS